MSITVLNPGLLTTVQDQGRIGYQQFGVSVSGVMDPRSASLANILVGNDEKEAVLECTMMGPQLQFDKANCIAITGGDLMPTLDGKPIPNYTAVKVEAGQVLKFTMPKTGCRAFIAFAGGLDIPEVMGSRSTYMKAKIGGVEGRKLAKGDVIGFRAPKAELKNMNFRSMASEFVPRKEYTVRVVLGPQDDYFTDAGIETFLTQVYSVTAEFDRMGCRLEGAVIQHKDGGDIISDGIAFGAIQVPSSGQPIIMLGDRQTTGGYTKIANVISADFRILAQLKQGDKVRFEKVSVKAAQDALLTQRAALKTIRNALEA
ncbi:MAG: biotin-dependent carboxyltransferase family protein [Clostridium sp.]|nr:biotin-dependent carboxyltransferase family protein [Clostridium sp.]